MIEVEPLEEVHEEAGTHSNWEFVGKVPTEGDVVALLSNLAPVWGVVTSEFAEFVQALPQKKKFKRPHPERSNLLIDDYVESWTLYMSVAGRQQMLREAQEENGWRVDIRPEPVTPTGVPGYLSFQGRLVYRVYVDIYERLVTEVSQEEVDVEEFRQDRLLGTRSGTAWVPETGGAQAAGSNPYEKVETSALGRAIGAWGFGVLPGSGIATVEEMAAIAGNQRYQDRQQSNGAVRESREELFETTMSVVEQYRQEAGKSEDEILTQVAAYLSERLGIPDVWDSVKRKIEWSGVKDGQLAMLRNAMRDGVKRLRDEQFGA